MRKIVGFKLSLRAKEIQRRAKKAKLDPQSTGDEASLQALLSELSKGLKPAVLFETFPRADPDQAALSSMPGLAYSLILATLGEGFVQRETPADLWQIVVAVALEDAVAFATRLLQDDAEKESCELSPLSALAEPAAVETAVRKLDGSKIGVAAAEGRLSPAASSAVSLSWLAKSKARSKPK